MKRELSEIISDMRAIVKPTIAKILKQINYENCGSTDKAEFETEFETVLTLAEMANNQWIPCSERMPEEREWIGTKKFGTTISDEVYVTLETISGKRFCDHIRFQNGKFSLSKQAELDAISKGTKPIAWMKQPEPYQPKDGVGK